MAKLRRLDSGEVLIKEVGRCSHFLVISTKWLQAGPYKTATMALARYLPKIALAAYIVSIRTRDDQLPMFAAIGIWLFYTYTVNMATDDPIYGPGFWVGAYGYDRRGLFNNGSMLLRQHRGWLRQKSQYFT